MFAWRSLQSESNISRKKIPYSKNGFSTLQWYKCGDPGLDGELVLCYSLENTNNLEETNLELKDRKLQTLTASGKKCSGKVSKWHSIAKPGTYNLNGTMK